MEKKELWMQKLKEKLNDYSEPIPSSGWERLEKELMPTVEKKIYPYRKWRFAAAAAVVLGMVASLSLYFLNTPIAEQIRSTPTLAVSPDALPNTPQPDRGTTVEPISTPAIQHNRLAIAHIPPTPETEQTPQQAPQQAPQKPEERTPPTHETTTDLNTEPDKPRRPSSRDKLHLPSEEGTARKGSWSVGLSVGNSGGTSAELNSGASGYASRINMESVSNDLMSIPSDQMLVFEQGVPYLRQVKDVVDIQHHQPISFGLSLRKQLRRGFSVETGLTYTLLTSDAKLLDSPYGIKQKLHYMGIPLRANWNVLDKKLFTLYVAGGGMIEKCVYGELGGDKETVNPLQFSVSGAVGAQVNATKNIGIYIEPGVAYFFDDGSDIQTIRKENPFNFNIQAGIRFTY